ncbi:hypothetical protein AB5E31_005060 [Salmonella enterica]|nr:hypothetical protein [Salmonella enterica]ELR5434867.1 hypothetical protein [Salmonella enterica subsp. enterica serovar Braenderup]EGB4927861.1 hypothetical protein [Salmonella enterica]EGC4211717.1 hypothetical protein [Salmonella enterica]EGC7641005.1 hypothetical protein [Salmonella enterica]
MTTRRCYDQPSARERTSDGSPEEGEEDEHTRHGGTTWRHLSVGGFIAGMVKAAHPFTDAASVMLTLRQLGWKPAARRAGPGQRSWPGAKHDSPGSRREVARVLPYWGCQSVH